MHRFTFVRRHVCGGRVIPRLHQCVQLGDQKRKPIVPQQRGLASDDLEQARHVREAIIAALPGLVRQPAQPA